MLSETRQVFSARAVVLANGFRPKLPRKLGLGRIKNFLVGAQTEIEAKNIDELEVYFGQEIAPGAFAWLVPTSAGRAYVGLLGNISRQATSTEIPEHSLLPGQKH